MSQHGRDVTLFVVVVALLALTTFAGC